MALRPGGGSGDEMAFKRYNTLSINYRAQNLPRNWRSRVEQVIRSVGSSFELSIATVKAGARKKPPGVLISIARDSAEEAWTDKCESTMKQRVLAVLDHAKEEEIARQVGAMGLDQKFGESAVDQHLVRAREKRRAGSAEEKLEWLASRRALTGDLAIVYRKAKLPAEAQDLADVAIKRMQEPSLWALWAQLLLVVQETRKVLPEALEERLRRLLK